MSTRRDRGQPPTVKKSKEWFARFRAHRAGAPEALRQAEELKPPITQVLPMPEVVRLGGEEFVVEQFRLKDLAELQAYIKVASPHPLRDIPLAWDDPEPSTRRARLFAAAEEAKEWPPKLGSPEGSAVLGTTAGRAFFLYLCLSRSDPSITIDRVRDLMPRVTPAEMVALRRVVWAISPWQEIMAELNPDEDEFLHLTDWCKAFNLAHEHRGYKYHEMGELYLSQWRNINQVGEWIRTAFSVTPRPGETPGEARLRVFRPDPEPDTGE